MQDILTGNWILQLPGKWDSRDAGFLACIYVGKYP